MSSTLSNVGQSTEGVGWRDPGETGMQELVDVYGHVGG
jgi:hypothetical protein